LVPFLLAVPGDRIWNPASPFLRLFKRSSPFAFTYYATGVGIYSIACFLPPQNTIDGNLDIQPDNKIEDLNTIDALLLQ
jgi:hypothetical protein